MTKIDAFAHILPPAYARRLESITSGAGVSERILGFRPWIHEDPALTGLELPVPVSTGSVLSDASLRPLAATMRRTR